MVLHLPEGNKKYGENILKGGSFIKFAGVKP